jgi:hypothetical protein
MMNKKFYFLMLLVLSLLISGCSGGKNYDTFAKCLTEKGLKMYGTSWCSHCKDQKKAFGSSFQYITYTDCEVESSACLAAGIKGYPTWKAEDGRKLEGQQSFRTLGILSGCPVTEG